MFLKVLSFLFVVGAVTADNCEWGKREPGDRALAVSLIREPWYLDDDKDTFRITFPKDGGLVRTLFFLF